MLNTILGEKIGMTQIFSPNGEAIPVTVIKAGPCFVVQRKTEARDGYKAIQIGFGERKENKVNKPAKGRFAKAGIPATRYLREVRVENVDEYKEGQKLENMFNIGDFVDIRGRSKGKGFAGPMKRWGFHGGPASHGSMSHRRVGSVGASSDPSRVFPGSRMPGRMGGDTVVLQKLEVVDVDRENSLILVKGSVPGEDRGLLVIYRTKKKVREKKKAEVKKETKKAASKPAAKKAAKPAEKKK